jgi:hypothetical protein
MASYAIFDDFGAIITQNGPEGLVGRRVIADYVGFGGRVLSEGHIAEVVYVSDMLDSGCIDHRVWAYGVTFDGYTDGNGRPIVVDLRRGEFRLPKQF